MTTSSVLAICAVVLTIGALVLIIYMITVLSTINRILRIFQNMSAELNKEFKPLLNDLSGIMASVNKVIQRMDTVYFDVSSFLKPMFFLNMVRKFAENPKGAFTPVMSAVSSMKSWIESTFLKKGVEKDEQI